MSIQAGARFLVEQLLAAKETLKLAYNHAAELEDTELAIEVEGEIESINQELHALGIALNRTEENHIREALDPDVPF
jgi:hypothetical protein